MGSLDITIIIVYLAVVIGAGFYYQKRAAADLDSYFLGGKRMHWLALSISGSVSMFDIAGTMWIVSLLFVLGMKSMWIHWMWGVMMGAFFLSYMGKWVRRSKVMTAAEWMVTRFGNDAGGKTARAASAILAIIWLASMIGYAFQGIGKFASVYFELDPNLCASIVIGITTLYVLLGGLYSVVVTDIIQTVILTIAAIVIGVLAYNQLTPEMIASRLPAEWSSLAPPWELTGVDKKAAEDLLGPGFHLFGALVLVWVFKGFLLNAGGPGQVYDFQRFLATRDARDAAKVGAAWSLFQIVRWGMCAGIVLLALTGFSGVSDPEKVMPLVLEKYLPSGVRGFVLAGFFAAFMSTFSSTVNTAASVLVRDLWQPYLSPHADDKALVRRSYMLTILIVFLGVAIGFQAKSIAEIWNWIIMVLGSAVVIPNALRWYWWRMNGWGYALGVLGGILLSFLAFPGMPWANEPLYQVFPAICGMSALFCIVGSLVTRPTEASTLQNFYQTVRPFGFWGQFKDRAPKSESFGLAALNTVLGMVAITGYYLCPMYLVGHWHEQALLCGGAALVSTLALYFTWYKNLPAAGTEKA